MKKSRLLGIVFACIPYLVSIPASAASYSITFYERTVSPAGNLFTDYITSGTATFEINDVVVSPNSLVLFTDSNFLAFDAIMSTTLGGEQFTLGIDDFPPVGDGTTVNKREQGILFDALGQPLRFDTPTTTAGNGAFICDPTCTTSVLNMAVLTLWDDDDFDVVYLNDGTITSRALAESNGNAFTPFSGEWDFNPLNSVGQTNSLSYYEIQAVPIPPAVWLFGSGLLGLIGIARHKKAV